MNPRTLQSLLCITIFCFSAAALSSAQTYTVLHSFDGTDGASPQPQLTQGFNGDLFGTAVYGGLDNDGVVFGFSTTGTLESLHSFNGSDGKEPFSVTTIGADGNLYGTTNYGGSRGFGTFYTVVNNKITPLYSFLGSAGGPAQSGVTLGSDGNFYGTTLGDDAKSNYGIAYQITPTGTLTVLHIFGFDFGWGSYSHLVEGPGGYFYGTTYTNGTGGEGDVFKINSSGDFINLPQLLHRRRFMP